MEDSERQFPRPLFAPGELFFTPMAMDAMLDSEQLPGEFLRRHRAGDWGDLDAEDNQANNDAVRNGTRILSAYKTRKGVKLWVITEWDRSVTTVLLPEEY
jgi:hypothetical protein